MGHLLPKPVTTKILERESTEVFHVGLASMNGFRDKMEDAHTVCPRGSWGFFGVFDGHCGPLCSEYVAKRFKETMLELDLPLTDEQIQDISLGIDKEFLDMKQEGGSTGTFMVAQKLESGSYHLQVGNVGDSRVVLGRRKDRISVTCTEDHKPTLDGERRRIEEAGGCVTNCRVDGALAVSRAFGDQPYKNSSPLNSKVIAVPEFTHHDAQEGDVVLLCCDGVFESDVFCNEGVMEFIFERLDRKMDLASIAADVCDEAMMRGSKDNISAMVVQLGGSLDCEQEMPKHEVRPGPFNATGNQRFSEAYSAMAAAGGMTDAECCELRFDLVSGYFEHKIKVTQCTERTCNFELLGLDDLRRLALANQLPDISDKDALVRALREVEKAAAGGDFRPVDVQEHEAELLTFDVPKEMAEMARGSEARSGWFQRWVANAKQASSEPDLTSSLPLSLFQDKLLA